MAVNISDFKSKAFVVTKVSCSRGFESHSQGACSVAILRKCLIGSVLILIALPWAKVLGFFGSQQIPISTFFSTKPNPFFSNDIHFSLLVGPRKADKTEN